MTKRASKKKKKPAKKKVTKRQKETFEQALERAADLTSKGRPEAAYGIYTKHGLDHSARRAKDGALVKAADLTAQNEFGKAQKIYEKIREGRFALISARREAAYSEAIKWVGLRRNLTKAEAQVNRLIQLGAYKAARELLSDLIDIAFEAKAKKKVVKLRKLMTEVEEREVLVRDHEH